MWSVWFTESQLRANDTAGLLKSPLSNSDGLPQCDLFDTDSHSNSISDK